MQKKKQEREKVVLVWNSTRVSKWYDNCNFFLFFKVSRCFHSVCLKRQGIYMNACMSLWQTLDRDSNCEPGTLIVSLWYRCKLQSWGNPATPRLSISHLWLLHAGGTTERERERGFILWRTDDTFPEGKRQGAIITIGPPFLGQTVWLWVFNSWLYRH